MEQPGVSTSEGMPLYWSESRVYSPAAREWLSVDPLVRWNPQALLDKPGNWHSVRYAGDNPLTFVDPTGEVLQLGPAFVGGGSMAIGTFGYSLLVGNSLSQSAINGAISGGMTFTAVATGGLPIFSGVGGKLLQTLVMTDINLGIQHLQGKQADFIKAAIGGFGYTFAGAAGKWGNFSLGADASKTSFPMAEKALLEGVKGFLGSNYSFVYSQISSYSSQQFVPVAPSFSDRSSSGPSCGGEMSSWNINFSGGNGGASGGVSYGFGF